VREGVDRRRRAVGAIAAVGVAALALGSGCKRVEPPKIDPVGAFNRVARPAFAPPADGLLTPAHVDLFLKVRAASRGSSVGDALASAGADAGEFTWVRARIQEALMALEADRVAAASSESYARGIAALREARKSARDAKTAARMDAEIAALERERAALRRPNAGIGSIARNAALVARRRSEIEAAGP
jgi:hypothetical protein